MKDQEARRRDLEVTYTGAELSRSRQSTSPSFEARAISRNCLNEGCEHEATEAVEDVDVWRDVLGRVGGHDLSNSKPAEFITNRVIGEAVTFLQSSRSSPSSGLATGCIRVQSLTLAHFGRYP